MAQEEARNKKQKKVDKKLAIENKERAALAKAKIEND